MPDELTRNEPEEPVHACSESAWVGRTGGWYCCHCGQWQCSITGRVSIRDPEPVQFHNPIARRRANKSLNPTGRTEDPVIPFDLTEIDYAFLEAFTNDWEPDPNTYGCGDT